MYGPHYVWIFLNSLNNQWWIPRAKESSACSDIEMKCQIQNHFSVFHTKLVTSGRHSFSYNNKVRKTAKTLDPLGHIPGSVSMVSSWTFAFKSLFHNLKDAVHNVSRLVFGSVQSNL